MKPPVDLAGARDSRGKFQYFERTESTGDDGDVELSYLFRLHQRVSSSRPTK